MVILGGMGNTLGVILAAILLTLLPELLRPIAEYRMIIYSFLLIVLMLVRPQGLFNYWASLRQKENRRPRRMTTPIESQETLIWRGTPSQWTNFGTYFFCLLLAAGVVAAYFFVHAAPAPDSARPDRARALGALPLDRNALPPLRNHFGARENHHRPAFAPDQRARALSGARLFGGRTVLAAAGRLRQRRAGDRRSHHAAVSCSAPFRMPPRSRIRFAPTPNACASAAACVTSRSIPLATATAVMPALLQLDKVTIRFGGLTAVNAVDFTVNEG